MSRYIDADALKKAVEDFPNCYNGWSDTYDKAFIIGAIEEQPTIKVVPKDFHDKTCEAMAKRHTEEIQRLMPKRGEWIWDNDAVDWNLGAWICSNCHARNDNIPHSERIIPLRWSGSKFCPNCGTDMRGESDDKRRSDI